MKLALYTPIIKLGLMALVALLVFTSVMGYGTWKYTLYAVVLYAVATFLLPSDDEVDRAIEEADEPQFTVETTVRTYSESFDKNERKARFDVSLKYMDAENQVTERDVSTKTITKYSKYYGFYGYCSLRRENRTFRSDRVIELTDSATGEIFEGKKIKGFFKNAYESAEA